MKLKLKINLILVSFTFLIAVLFFAVYQFGELDLIAKSNENYQIKEIYTKPLKNESFSLKSGTVSFEIIPKRNYVSSIILFGKKPRYFFGEENSTLSLNINYVKNSGQEVNVHEKIAVSDLGSYSRVQTSIFKINIPPLEDCKNRKVFVSISSDQDNSALSELKIWNDDYDPNPYDDAKPKITYRVYANDFFCDLLNNFDNDPKFFKYYYILVGTIFLTIIVLLIVEKKKD